MMYANPLLAVHYTSKVQSVYIKVEWDVFASGALHIYKSGHSNPKWCAALNSPFKCRTQQTNKNKVQINNSTL